MNIYIETELKVLCLLLISARTSLVAEMVKNLPSNQETWVPSLYWEDPMEKGMAIHPNIPAWIISWTGEPGGLQSMGLQRGGHNWATDTSTLLTSRDLVVLRIPSLGAIELLSQMIIYSDGPCWVYSSIPDLDTSRVSTCGCNKQKCLQILLPNWEQQIYIKVAEEPLKWPFPLLAVLTLVLRFLMISRLEY